METFGKLLFHSEEIAGGARTWYSLGCFDCSSQTLYTKIYASVSDAAWQVRNCSLVMREFCYLGMRDEEIACWSSGSELGQSLVRAGICSVSCMGVSRSARRWVMGFLSIGSSVCRSVRISQEKRHGVERRTRTFKKRITEKKCNESIIIRAGEMGQCYF